MEPLTPGEVAALAVAGDVWIAAPPVVVSGWRVTGLGEAPAYGVRVFAGLTPRLAAVLITLHSRAGHLVLDLTADLAVEGAAGAGDRRYARIHPAAAGILAGARRHQGWPPVDLVLISWPRPDALPDLEPELPQLMRECRDLLDARGHLIAVVGLGTASSSAEAAGEVLATARQAHLHLWHHHLILTQPAPGPGGQSKASPRPRFRTQVDLLVFTLGDRDDD